MFYLSGSSKVNIDERDKFNSIYHNFNQFNDLEPFHTNKFYSTSSIFYIPQQRFGERIKPGSFQITARHTHPSETTDQIKIVDDSKGNLYSTNATFSQSVSALSSSDNYVGNISKKHPKWGLEMFRTDHKSVRSGVQKKGLFVGF